MGLAGSIIFLLSLRFFSEEKEVCVGAFIVTVFASILGPLTLMFSLVALFAYGIYCFFVSIGEFLEKKLGSGWTDKKVF